MLNVNYFIKSINTLKLNLYNVITPILKCTKLNYHCFPTWNNNCNSTKNYLHFGKFMILYLVWADNMFLIPVGCVLGIFNSISNKQIHGIPYNLIPYVSILNIKIFFLIILLLSRFILYAFKMYWLMVSQNYLNQKFNK